MAVITVGVPNVLSPSEIAYIVQGGGWSHSGDDAVIAVAVALAESGGNANAHNPVPPDDSYGLWQINMYSTLGAERFKKYGYIISKKEDLYDPRKNASMAYAIWKDGGGWNAWSTYKNGDYKKHLDEARKGVSSPVAPHTDPDGGGQPGDPQSSSNILEQFVNFVFNLLKPVVLRTAGFIGGGALVIIAIILYVRSQQK